MQNLSGQTIDRYHILEQIGEGGMAVVYKAYDTRLEREVAIKIIRKEAFPAETYDHIFRRFEREAKALAKLSHPNIIKVYDYGEFDGSPYLVMEYQPGGTLKAVLGEPLSWQDCIKYVLPIAQALAYAHQLGIIHRDIKPSNILISNNGLPMLSDFGIAKLLESDGKYTLTGTGVGIGTPEYMAPEQGLGKPIDTRADIYALGVVLYEMVTGRTPYQAETPMAVIIAHISDPLPNPREIIKDMPKEVERLLLKSMAKAPENRYQNMNEFERALNNISGVQYSNHIDGEKLSNTESNLSKNGNGKSDVTIDEGIYTKIPKINQEHHIKMNWIFYALGGVIVIAILALIFVKYDFTPRKGLPQATPINVEITAPQGSTEPTLKPTVIATKKITPTISPLKNTPIIGDGLFINADLVRSESFDSKTGSKYFKYFGSATNNNGILTLEEPIVSGDCWEDGDAQINSTFTPKVGSKMILLFQFKELALLFITMEAGAYDTNQFQAFWFSNSGYCNIVDGKEITITDDCSPDLKPDTWYYLTFQVINNSIYLSYWPKGEPDSLREISYPLPINWELSKLKYHIVVPKGTVLVDEFQEFEIASTSTLSETQTSESTVRYGNELFTDDFESGQNTDWSFNGFWKIVKDEGNNSVLQREGSQIAHAEVGTTDWKNYEIKTRVKVLEYGTDQYNGTFSIGFRSNCRNSCPEYSWGFQKTFQNLGRETTGWKEFMVSDYKLPLDTWLDIRIEVIDDVLHGYVNEEIFFETTDPNPLLNGNIRLVVMENAKVWFDDVKVTELLSSTP